MERCAGYEVKDEESHHSTENACLTETEIGLLAALAHPSSISGSIGNAGYLNCTHADDVCGHTSAGDVAGISDALDQSKARRLISPVETANGLTY